MFNLKSITFRIACITPVIIRVPPGAPITISSLPSLVTIVGVMLDNIRLPGAIAFASPPIAPYIFNTPGFAEKSSISLFNKNPSPGTVTPLP